MVARFLAYKLEAYGSTDIGLVRQKNEDVFSAIPELHFFIVADGMGGHRAGEIAAKEAVTALCHLIKKHFKTEPKSSSLDQLRDYIEYAIELTNSHVFKLSRTNENFKGMGTTICCLQFYGSGLVYAHVGDSRIYRMRMGKLEQMTKDHSLLRELVDSGMLDAHQASDFLYKNIITRAIGTESKVEPSIHMTTDIAIHDVYMMCSDGLSDLLSQKEIEAIMHTHSDLREATNKLISGAKVRGGHDNITIFMVKVEEHSESQDLS